MATITTSIVNINSGADIPLGLTSPGSTQLNLLDAYTAQMFHCDETKTAVILNRIDAEVTDSADGVAKKTVHVARDIHKMLCSSKSAYTSYSNIGSSTTFSHISNGSPTVDVSVWQPYKNKSVGDFQVASLTAAEMGSIAKIGVDIKVGLKLDYTDSSNVASTRFCPLSVTSQTWAMSSSSTRRQFLISSPTTFTLDTPTSATSFKVDDILGGIGSIGVFSKFGRVISDFKGGSALTVTPIVYCGPAVTDGTVLPVGYSAITGATGVELKWGGTVGAVAPLFKVTVSNADTAGNSGLSDDYGWVSEYDGLATTDTSVNVTITSA